MDGSAPSTEHLTACVPGWERRSKASRRVVGVLAGEGIGPEVVEASLLALEAVTQRRGLDIEIRRGDPLGSGFSDDVAAFCRSIFDAGGALLCGPAGGRFVYDLRQRFDLFCKLVPIRPLPVLAGAAIVRPERLAGVDMLIVRENVGGLYFGEYGSRDGGRTAYQHLAYTAAQVSRIIEVAARLARMRRGQLAVVVKTGGIPAVSTLWRECAAAVAAEGGPSAETLEADTAAFQLIAEPQRFDVIVAPNLFGDLLADAAAVLLGSRGMSYSANFGPDGRAAYQTGHGAARELARSNRANPVAQMLSVAMMLRESFGLDRAALQIETAIEQVLASGWRTADIAGPQSRVVGTRELAERIADVAAHLAGETRQSA
jgi:3-isopropylmalate dehydrogenase